MTAAPLLETNFTDLPLHGRGKVRDIYTVGDDLLLVATDRISAFDYVLGSGIPDKGKVLTQLSAFWFERMGDLVPHHVIATDVAAYPAALQPHAAAADRMRRAQLLVELRLEGIPADRPRLRRDAAVRTAGIRPASGADLH